MGCHQPEKWSFTGPRVYLIEGAADEDSEGLSVICHELERHEINARLYTPEDWLKIVVDIDAKPDEEAILVGHGHGAFLATQVVRHYAQCHKTKFIDAVITIDADNKDWPHNAHESGERDPHVRPMPIPVGHNAIKVRNFNQRNPQSLRWGSDLVSTRDSNVAEEHPYYWYDDFWDRNCRVTGQSLREDVTSLGVTHETIDNDAQLVQRIVTLCRKAALSPYHYTPPEHYPDVQRQVQPELRGERLTGDPQKQADRQQ
jgi:pimeloyl-ACP methyl ester carboxylesterase